MMQALDLQQLRAVVGGEVRGAASFDAVSTDTRSLQPGALFVALQGPNFDGNRFVAQARTAGAVAAMVSAWSDDPLPQLKVDDTRRSLGRLAAWNRAQSKATVVALTGSQGKTTVKELTAAILARSGAVLSTAGNLNNDIGAPLTLLRIDPGHRYAVIELGANAKGEIAYTTALTRPDIALINNVAATHVEGFGSLLGVAEGKSELWQGLGPDGTAIINMDDPNIVPRVSAGLRRIRISASGSALADYRVGELCSDGLSGSRFMLHTPHGSRAVMLPLPGQHNAANALAAAALAMEAGASLDDIAAGLAAASGVKGRLKVRKGLNGAVVIDDSYNASPASFRAAIDVLAAQAGSRIVVAGDMAELGADAETAHRELGEYAAGKGIERFLGTGVLTELAVRAFGAGAEHAPDCDALVVALRPLLAPDVSILVKGSRSAGMERVVKKLTEHEE